MDEDKVEIGQIWYDPFTLDYYTVLKFDKNSGLLTIQWESYGIITGVPITECVEDIYIRTLSRLEMALL